MSNPLMPLVPAHHDFTFLETADGSPTVRIGAGDASSEAMHSLRGAFSETVYIYGTAIELCLKSDFEPRILSLGLGLGYVEILTAALALQRSRGLDPENSSRLLSQISGESFELLPELRDWFTAWVLLEGPTDEGAPQDALATRFHRTYDAILARTAQHLGLDASPIRALLKQMFIEKRWLIREALTDGTHFEQRFGCICFDAFSSKTSPLLWTEEFLKAFLQRTAATGTVLSTYACTGALKRALRECRFSLEVREGYSSKRDSTFAVRGKDLPKSFEPSSNTQG